MVKRPLIMIVFLLLLLASFGCAKEPTGTVEVRVTDAPQVRASSIIITADNVEVHQADGGWMSVVKETKEFDLMQIQGREEILGEKELGVGRYTQLRVKVSDVRVTIDGQERVAKIPSSELKLIRPFEVIEGQTTVLTLDFDASESIVIQKEEVEFKPVVRLLMRKTPEPGLLTPGLLLDVIEPLDETVVNTARVTVKGISAPDAVVTVNGALAELDDRGNFSLMVTLEEGPNTIEVIATDYEGNETSRVLAIIYIP